MVNPVSFRGAKVTFDDDGERTYEDRGEIVVDENEVIAYYDHAVMLERHTIYVMETMEEIKKIIGEALGAMG